MQKVMLENALDAMRRYEDVKIGESLVFNLNTIKVGRLNNTYCSIVVANSGDCVFIVLLPSCANGTTGLCHQSRSDRSRDAVGETIETIEQRHGGERTSSYFGNVSHSSRTRVIVGGDDGIAANSIGRHNEWHTSEMEQNGL
jgi:hypothetical protein